MDPVANLKEQLKLAEKIQARASNEDRDTDDLLKIEEWAVRLSELVQAMDEWRKNGGFDPYTKNESPKV